MAADVVKFANGRSIARAKLRIARIEAYVLRYPP
jgi:hypothetical protein